MTAREEAIIAVILDQREPLVDQTLNDLPVAAALQSAAAIAQAFGRDSDLFQSMLCQRPLVEGLADRRARSAKLGRRLTWAALLALYATWAPARSIWVSYGLLDE